MDANRQRFWLLADAAHWPWLEHVDHRPGCRALHLASERSLGATADDAAAIATAALERLPMAIDREGAHAWWDEGAGALLARSHLPGTATLLALPERPQKIVIHGAGYIALEFAGIFNQLGSEVHVVFRRETILNPGFDTEVRTFLQKQMEAKGIKLHPGTNVARVEKTECGVSVTLTDNTAIQSGAILFATGRVPNIEPLGLDEVGVELAPGGAIKVDRDQQTSIPSIYAIGDVTGHIALTPVAIAEGHALADRLYGGLRRYISYENVPHAIFSNPPVGQVGLTEEQALEKHPGKIDVYRDDFLGMKNALAGRDERTLVKLIVHSETGRVLGLHMVGQDAPEITQGFATAIVAGATKADFDRTIAIHPTIAEEFVLLRHKLR